MQTESKSQVKDSESSDPYTKQYFGKAKFKYNIRQTKWQSKDINIQYTNLYMLHITVYV